jgi:glycosyltransferase involved in cell wall biosynthesis
MRFVRKILRAGNYDIAHAFTARAVSALNIAAMGMPVRCVAYRGTMGRVNRLDPSSWLTFLHPRLDAIVCVSDAVRLFLERYVAPRKLVTIHKGHDLVWYHPAPVLTRRGLGVPEEAILVACVGTIRPVKGVRYLLEAVGALPASSRIHLLIAGEIQDRDVEKLLAAPEIRSRVTTLGPRRDVPSIYQASDIAVTVSIEREGLPKAVIEAMCMSLPVVVTGVGGMPEIVTDGREGLVVPPRDPQAIATALQRLERNESERRAFGDAARKTIEARFNIEDSIAKTQRLYERLMADKHAAEGSARKAGE